VIYCLANGRPRNASVADAPVIDELLRRLAVEKPNLLVPSVVYDSLFCFLNEEKRVKNNWSQPGVKTNDC
jgi:hypothetical protein